MLLLLPVVFVFLLAVVQFSLMITVEQRLAEASARGARVAAQGGSLEEVRITTTGSLGSGKLKDAEILVRVTDERGQPLLSGESTEVVVRIKAKEAVPDLLGCVGFRLGDRVLTGRTVMRKE